MNIIKMIILSILRYGEEAYSSASKAVLKKLEPTHNRGIRLALGVFAVCRTDNALCKAGVSTLADKRNLNNHSFISNPNHPIRPYCLNQTKLDEYQQPQNLYSHHQWSTVENYRSTLEKSNASHSTSDHQGQISTTYSIIYFVQTDEEHATKDSKLKLNKHHIKIYTDGSKKDKKVGYAVVLSESTIKKRQFTQNSICSAEQSAIINAIYSTTNYNQKRVIITDSLSTIIAVSVGKRSKNPKTQLIRKLIDQASKISHYYGFRVTWGYQETKQLTTQQTTSFAASSFPRSVINHHTKTYPPQDLIAWIKEKHEQEQ
jgi:hypothetical protein